MRIFYVGKAADGCRVVEYGGTTIVWAPPGCRAVKKLLPVIGPNGKPVVREYVSGPKRGSKINITKKQWVVELGADNKPSSGPLESFHDLTPEAVRVVLNAANNDDGLLVTEAQYRESQNIGDLELQVAELQKLIEKKRSDEAAQVPVAEARADATSKKKSAGDKLKDAAAYRDV